MKDNLEKNIKQSLENHEMPYNASAWTAMQAKLDVVKPVTSPSSNLKRYISAASVVVIGVVAYVALNNSAESTNETTKQTATTELVDTKTNSTTESNTENVITTNTTSNPSRTNGTSGGNSNVNTRTNSSSASNSQNKPFTMTSRNGDAVNSTNTANNSGENKESLTGNNSSGTTKPNSSKNYSLPSVSEICEGESTTIKNTNDVALMIEGPDMQFMIPANSERKVRMTKEGMHEISVMTDDNGKKSTKFFVKSAPKADFTIDTDTKFEKGLPTTKLEATTSGVEYSWIIGKSRVYGEEVDAHFYKSGNQDVTLTVKDANGCSSSTTKSIHIDEKYNLMAVNSFIPEDIDPRNNTFMPFALTQRDVKFNLIIIDPTDGHTVFQSNDASNAWNGVDKTTGNNVNYGTTYIWKVTISNPEPNENNEYGGQITPIRKR